MKTTLSDRLHAEIIKMRKELIALRNAAWAHNDESAKIGDKINNILDMHYKRIPHVISGDIKVN